MGFLSYLFADGILVQADCFHFYFSRFLLFAKDKVVLYLSLRVLAPAIVNAFDTEVSSHKMHKLSEKDQKIYLPEGRASSGLSSGVCPKQQPFLPFI